MKKQELVDKLESLPTAELADLAGVSLRRGRPSAALRQDLVDTVLDSIREKRLRVTSAGTIVRRK